MGAKCWCVTELAAIRVHPRGQLYWSGDQRRSHREVWGFNPPPPLSSRAIHEICTEPMKNISGTKGYPPNYACCTLPWTPQGAPLQNPAPTPHCKTSGLATAEDSPSGARGGAPSICVHFQMKVMLSSKSSPRVRLLQARLMTDWLRFNGTFSTSRLLSSLKRQVTLL